MTLFEIRQNTQNRVKKRNRRHNHDIIFIHYKFNNLKFNNFERFNNIILPTIYV